MENRPVPKLGVLISGRGSNLGAIIGAIDRGEVRAQIAVVISNRAEAGGLDLARAHGIETLVMPHGAHANRAAYDDALAEALRARGVVLVCLAGFMRVLGPAFCAAFPHAVLNVHPSLLPAFPGTHAQRQALEHGVRISGATVHFVSAELDAGPIVMQASVPVAPDDTEATLSARILVEEHRIYPRAIQFVLDGGWKIEGRRVLPAAGAALR